MVTDPRQPDNPIVLANRAFLELTGCGAEEVIGRNCRILQGPETSREAIDEVRVAVARQEEANVELLNYRKDECQQRTTFGCWSGPLPALGI